MITWIIIFIVIGAILGFLFNGKDCAASAAVGGLLSL